MYSGVPISVPLDVSALPLSLWKPRGSLIFAMPKSHTFTWYGFTPSSS